MIAKALNIDGLNILVHFIFIPYCKVIIRLWCAKCFPKVVGQTTSLVCRHGYSTLLSCVLLSLAVFLEIELETVQK